MFGRIKLRKTDKLFSDYIRTRDKWTCLRCGNKPVKQGLHCSHYWGRGREAIRFEPDNAISLCFACHKLWGHGDGRDQYREYMTLRLGKERFKSLELQANCFQRKDDKLCLIWLREKLKELE